MSRGRLGGCQPAQSHILASLRIFSRRDDRNAQSKQSRINRISAWTKKRKCSSVEYRENTDQVAGAWTNQQIGNGRCARNHGQKWCQEADDQ